MTCLKGVQEFRKPSRIRTQNRSFFRRNNLSGMLDGDVEERGGEGRLVDYH